MKIENGIIVFGVLLAACAGPIGRNDAGGESSSSSTISEANTSSAQPLAFEKALDQTFSSQKLGIAFRYPSVEHSMECNVDISVTARETDTGVEFVQEWMPGEGCTHLPGAVFNGIHAQRATDKTGLRHFIDKVFSANCEIVEEDDFEDGGEKFTNVFLKSKTPSSDGGPDFACSEVVRWNKTAGVAMFSYLGSKTGGGIDWPASAGILMPDGSVEYAFDYPIMQSIRYLKAE